MKQNSERLPRFGTGLVLSLLLCAPLAAQKPRLTVLIVADQFRADYMEQYRADFSAGGLERMTGGGAYYRTMRFGQAVSLTAPGAATLATGADASSHGIVADAWYDAVRRQVVSAEGDPKQPSPAFLVGSTLADQIKLASRGEAKVVAVSDDAALAVMLAGRAPDGVYWRGADGAMRSSTAYGAAPPAWVQEFNTDLPPGPAGRRAWKALGAADDAPPLRTLDSVDFLRLYRASPFAEEDLFEFARRAIAAEKLGKRGYSDLLIIGLGAPGLLSLETGAYSPLMRDLAGRIDRDIEGFLGWLQDWIGLDQAAVVFSATHGIPPDDQALHKAGIERGRIAGAAVVEAVNQRVSSEFRDIAVEKFLYPFVTFTPPFRTLTEASQRRVLELAGEAAIRLTGVAGYYSPKVTSLRGDALERLRRSYVQGRSGDLMLVYEPYYTERFADDRGVAPGSPYRYDTDVPLVLFGQWFENRVFENVIDANQLAPTLCALLGLAQPSGASGQVLTEALRPRPRATVGPPAPPAVE